MSGKTKEVELIGGPRNGEKVTVGRREFELICSGGAYEPLVPTSQRWRWMPFTGVRG